jgi:nucleoside-diphosphate-sugar epimerase
VLVTDHKKILITGNMGYVGPGVETHLRDLIPSAILAGMDSGIFAHCLTGAKRLPETVIDQQIFSDVRDVTPELLKGVTGIVHLAAISNDPMGKSFESATAAINHIATVQLAKIAKTAGVKNFVFASSCSMYGAANEEARTETAPLNPLTAYARSKVASEADLKVLANAEFEVTCLRFPTACGMSPRLRLDLVLNDFVASAIANKEIVVLSDGSPWRPLIDVRDMARAIGWALTRESGPEKGFLAVNVGKNEWNYQVRDLAIAVSDACAGVKVSINTDAAPDNRSYRVNFDLFNSMTSDDLLIHDLASSIGLLKEGLEGMSFSDGDFRSTQWMRLKVLQQHMDEGAIDKEIRWT